MPMGSLSGKQRTVLREPNPNVMCGYSSGRRPVCLRDVEERALVRLGTQPPAASIAQHGVQNHHPLDHAADRLQTAIAVVRLPDGLVERLVVNVVETPSPDGSWLDGSGESAGDQAGDEFAAVLATRRAGERAVLPFQEAPGVDHDRHEELTLPLREAEVTRGPSPG